MAAAGQWCILTVKWRHRERTLKLSEALASDGYEVWVPILKRRVEVPRLGTRREVSLPLLPGYIFAQGRHLVDLIQLAKRHPSLRVFRTPEGFRLAADRALQSLRDHEMHLAERYRADCRKEKRQAEMTLSPGDKIRARDGSFGGKEGVVLRSDQRRTFVCFDRFFNEVEIATSIITEDEAYELQFATDAARIAA